VIGIFGKDDVCAFKLHASFICRQIDRQPKVHHCRALLKLPTTHFVDGAAHRAGCSSLALVRYNEFERRILPTALQSY